ncbi:hypothetical protein TRVA0_012S00210 [Trichomonascus vanleenenianus]|uniref:uncharacterized protein n=1 Tax=Trichomonascus vanleenenianus TaxID=2268995 RepID=UPI003ECA2BCC
MVLTGRGGYGNYRRSADTTDSTYQSSPAPVQHFTSPKQNFRAGRGGYGNHVSIDRMPTLTPQEYLDEVHQALNVEPKRYFTGRGGMGNYVQKEPSLAPPPSEYTLAASKSAQSYNSQKSDGLWSKLKTTFSH